GPVSTRRLGDGLTWRRAIAVAVVVILAAGPAVWASSAKHVPEPDGQRHPMLRYACAWRQFGLASVLHVLHRAHSLQACAKGGGLPVELAIDRPAHVCRVRHASGDVPAGLLRLVDERRDCASPRVEISASLPGSHGT